MVITGLTRNQLAGNRTWVRIPPAPPEKPTSFDLSVFQLSAPFGAWSLLRKWSCPADSEVSAEVSGALNFILCARIILHYAVRHNFTSALADTSLKTARVRSHPRKLPKMSFSQKWGFERACIFVMGHVKHIYYYAQIWYTVVQNTNAMCQGYGRKNRR